MESAEADGIDPDWVLQNHPACDVLDGFDADMLEWVTHLAELSALKNAGYPFHANDLTPLDWKALGVLEAHREAQASETLQSQARDRGIHRGAQEDVPQG